MLQIKYILLNGKENLKLYSEIINQVAREYKEFRAYKINNDLEGLLLEFDVNNSYGGFDLTFLKEDFDFESNKNGTEYKVAYFDNEKETSIKLIIDRYEDKKIRIQSLKNNQVRNVVTIEEQDSVESNIYNLNFYKSSLVDEKSKLISNLNIEGIGNIVLDYFGVQLGYLFSRTSKEIITRDIANIIY